MINKESTTKTTLKNKNNILPFNKKLVAVLMSSSLLFACGGSGSSGSSAVQNINGTASKGLILGGAVTAYLINTNGAKGAVVGTATTNTDDGEYELILDSSYDGEALIIEITAADGSEMKCDLSVCKAGETDELAITFGERYPLPSNFELSAVSSGAESGAISINITPLTNIAAALTLDKVVGGANPAAAAAASNSQVANLLGLDGDVTMLPIVDLTDAGAINAASADALKANLKSAAVVEAALSNSPASTSIEEALKSFVTQYVSSNGVADREEVESPSVSLEEIAAASEVLTSKFTELEGVSAESANIASVKTALIAEKLAASTGSTQPTQGNIPDNIGSEGLVAAKAFVKEVSTFSVLSTQLDGANTFKSEISLASDLASGDLDVNSEALALATAAIAEAVEAVLDALDKDEVPMNSHIYETEHGDITVAIGLSSTAVTYTVAQELDIQDTTTTIDMVANATLTNDMVDTRTEEGTTSTLTAEGTASINLSLSGSVSTDETSITINDGSNVIATLTVDEEEEEIRIPTIQPQMYSSYSETASGELSLTGVDLGLSVTIAQVGSTEVTDPISFTGALNIAASLISLEYDEEWGYDQSSSTNNGTETISINGLTASLTGTFSNSSDNLEATVAIVGSGIKETCTWDYDWSNTTTLDDGLQDNYNNQTQGDDCNLDETASKYASASINVRFTLDIDGIEDPIELVAAIERTGLESGVASIDLTYGGNQLDFEFDTDDIVEVGDTTITTTMTATLTDHNGVTLTVTDIETDYVTGSDSIDTYVTTGVISHEGEEFAIVSEEGKVTFSDGTIVSL